LKGADIVADPILDEINLTTLPEIYDAAIEDNFFSAPSFKLT